MPAPATDTSPRSPLDSGVRDLFASLATHLRGSDPAVLGFVGLGDPAASASFLDALATITAEETEKTVLVVTAVPSSETEWPIYCVVGPDVELHMLGAVTGDAQSAVGTLQSVLSACRDATAGFGVGRHAGMRVPAASFAVEPTGKPLPVRQLMLAARGVFDVVLVDLPVSTRSLHALVDGVVLVVTPEADVAQVTATARRVGQHGGSVLGVVIETVVIETVVIETKAPAKPELSEPGLERVRRKRVRLLPVAAVFVIVLMSGDGLRQLETTPDERMVVASPPAPLSSRVISVSRTVVTAPVATRTLSAVALGVPPPTNEILPGPVVAASEPQAEHIVASQPVVEEATQVFADSPVVPEPVAQVLVDPRSSPTQPFPRADDATLARGDGVTEPERLPEFAAQPRFTTMAGLETVDARVLLSAVVKADGTVGDVQLIELTGGPAAVVKPAIEAVKQWRYRPATRDGRPVDARTSVLVDFRGSS